MEENTRPLGYITSESELIALTGGEAALLGVGCYSTC